MDTPPAVSVLIPVKDGADYLEEALRAVMAQTFRDIEILVVDDGSRDATAGILARMAAQDERLRILTNETNMGLPNALNRGLDAAQGTYIARMDADDIAEPGWLEVLHAYLEARPKVVLAGASVRLIDPKGAVIGERRLSHRPDEMRFAMRFHTPIVHPSVMFRRTAVTGRSAHRYDPAFRTTEDYDLFSRILETGDGVNLSDILVNYRIHPTSVSQTRWREQVREARDIALRVQARELPADVMEALAPVRAAFFDLEPHPPRAILGGLRAALRHDAARLRPGWAADEALRLYNMAMRRSGRGRVKVLAGLAHAPDLALRAAVFRRRRG